LNSRGGRDHYRQAMSVAMIGAASEGRDGSRARRTVPERTSWTRDGAREADLSRRHRRDDLLGAGIDWTKTIDDTPSGGV
jgi:hypothetical protein